MESMTDKKKISKLAVVSLLFIIMGFLALPLCRIIRMLFEMNGHDLMRFQTYSIALVFWLAALLFALPAVILIRLRPEKHKGLRLPLLCLIASPALMVGYSIPLPETQNTVIVSRDKTFEGNSSELKYTAILPTLNSSAAQNQNLIWCSSFQLAWNEFKNDIVQEPVLLSSSQKLADLLNQAPQSKQDILDSDYYAKAGFVKDDIIGTIRRDMLQKFPDEPVPAFDDAASDTAIIAYAFIAANVRFKIPYFENDKEMLFTDSTGKRTPVTSFGIREEDDYAYYPLRRQIQILFNRHDSNYKLTECAIDLYKDSSPNQIVLALVESKETLTETLAYIEEQHQKNLEKDYDAEFGPNDILLVPNLFWKITHSFDELEGNTIANPKYQGMPIAKATQVIQFRLDRSGAEIKSESKLYCLPVPTYYVFDRPFLIYIKKRDAEYPFFVMWVDNAELLKKYSDSKKP
ncbi:MAG: hypothetical protein JXB18_00435 [Sedimentisphaerales bacterium]|nr:hypothetical protein [Sedimentisphaerales bacterium]